MSDPFIQDIYDLSSRIKGHLPGSTFLITGATGLIGSYIVEVLTTVANTQSSVTEVCAVSASGSIPPWLTTDPIVNRRFGNLADSKFVRSLPKADVVVHAAGYGQPGKFIENPTTTYRINTEGTGALLQRVNPGGTFLFLSSSEVYSGLANGRFEESQVGTTNTDHPRACYIEGKRGGETLTNIAAQEAHIIGLSARVALAYGPGTQAGDTRVLNEFIRSAISTGIISLRDHGRAKRTYCYIRDAIDLLFTVLNSRKPGIYNVGGKSQTTIADLAQAVANCTQSQVVIPNELSRQLSEAPDVVDLDLQKVLDLGREPDWVSLAEGVRRTVEWQRRWLGVSEIGQRR